MSAISYIVITPVRNEEKYLPGTIQCMAGQTILPAQWLLIDDGSTDDTGRILDEAAARFKWITVIHRKDRGFRQAGSGVMQAFYEGYRAVGSQAWQFLVKLDGDLTFSKDYFENCFKRFAANPKLGIAGGLICSEVNGVLEAESKIDPAFHVRGATKIYRRECWDQIGGLITAPGWDTVDEVKANMVGWSTCTFSDLPLVHHRPAGMAYGQWSNVFKNGRANYVAGYHPLFMFVKCLRRTIEKPYLIEACGLWAGFVSGYLKRIPQVPDPGVIKYFRQQQINRLLGRKSLWS
jgi:biofilm PGA synthesis N-glycosyltransferase PgaC